MPIPKEANVQLPLPPETQLYGAKLLYCTDQLRRPYLFLHAVRSPQANIHYLPDLERGYKAEAAYDAEKCAQAVDPPDLIAQAPSSRKDAEPFFQALQQAYPKAMNLSSFFSKTSSFKAGAAQTFDEVKAAIRFDPDETSLDAIRNANHMVIVDDVLATGRTLAAMMFRLHQVNPNLTFSVICPLWIKQSTTGAIV
jgi:hypothetical protein